MRSESLDATGPHSSRLRIEFIHRGDRYGHLISLVEPGGNVAPLLESIEGSPTDAWPASPPLQSLHVQELPGDRRAALLVGMAGRSHWSASIEATSAKAELAFDIACRCGEPGVPGSSYRLLADKLVRSEHDHQRVELWTSAGTKVAVAVGDDLTGIPASAENLWIGVVPFSGPFRSTARWRYQISVLSTGQ